MVFALQNICHHAMNVFTIVSSSPMFPTFSVVIHALIVLSLSIRCELLVATTFIEYFILLLFV